MDTLGENNVGFKMLQKFGWKGSGLGKSEQGQKSYGRVAAVLFSRDCTVCLDSVQNLWEFE